MPSKANTAVSQRPHSYVLVYGQTGAGKTTWAAKSPRPLVLLTEAHGLHSVNAVAPDALVEVIQDWKHLCLVMRALKKGGQVMTEDGQSAYIVTMPDRSCLEEWAPYSGDEEPRDYVIQTVVLDSLSDVHQRVVDHYPPQKGKDGTEGPAWMKVQKAMSSLLSSLRQLPVSIVVLALASERQDESKRRYIEPALFGQLSRQVGQYFSGVGYAYLHEAYNAEGKREHSYRIAWRASASTITKSFPRHGFPDYTDGVTMGEILLWLSGDNPTTPRTPRDNPKALEESQGEP